jgi:hypothetical protein
MSCESCDEMLSSDATLPHGGLRAVHKPKKLRPLGHKPVLVQHYQCRQCGTNWICESSPETGDQQEWTCLHHASSILDPLAVTEEPPSLPDNRQSGSAVGGSEPETRDAPDNPFWLGPPVIG